MTDTDDLNERVARARGWDWSPCGCSDKTCGFWVDADGLQITDERDAITTDPALWGPMLVELVQDRQVDCWTDQHRGTIVELFLLDAFGDPLPELFYGKSLGEAVCRAWLSVFQDGGGA